MRRTFICGILVPIMAAILFVPAAASAEIEMYGDLLTSYRDADTGPGGADGNSTFQIDQFDLAVFSDLNEYASVYARGSFTPATSSITEAWIKLDGLPYDMEVTVGRFYRPLGVRIPTVGQSYPSLVMHSFTDLGIKLNGEHNWLNWEAGYVNGRPLSRSQATIGNLPVYANISSATSTDEHKDLYGHVGISVGEPWGSLDLGIGLVSGRLGNNEVAIINPFYNNPTGERDRLHAILSLDYTYRWFNIYAEYDKLQDGQLHRSVNTVAFTGRYRKTSFTIGYDRLDPDVDNKFFVFPETWERQTVRVMGRYEITPTVIVQTEYQFNDEDVMEPRGNDFVKVENDMWISQLLVYF